MFEKVLENRCLRLFLPILLLSGSASVAMAQIGRKDYTVYDDVVLYRGMPLDAADPDTFVMLGHGYAKDADHVYLDGQILRYVDPLTFRLKRPLYVYDEYDEEDPRGYMPRDEGYVTTSNTVLFNGRIIEGVSVSSFEVLQGGYARDAFQVYFRGRKIDAGSSSFRYLGDGYAADSFNVFFFGHKMEGVMRATFKVLDGGYAEDAFSTYYLGRKVQE